MNSEYLLQAEVLLEHHTSTRRYRQALLSLSRSAHPGESLSGDKKWMRGGSQAMRGALLGILLERPGHGGDLASRMAARLGDTWRVDTNDVYRLLAQLENSGLAISSEGPMRDNSARRHVVYRPTEATAEALTLWMETLGPREPVRLGLHAKLLVARPHDAPLLLVALSEYERECRTLVRHVSPAGGQARSWAALRVDCAREAVLAQLQSEIDWSARTRKRINASATRNEYTDRRTSPAAP